jgi:hypothetical protein
MLEVWHKALHLDFGLLGRSRWHTSNVCTPGAGIV